MFKSFINDQLLASEAYCRLTRDLLEPIVAQIAHDLSEDLRETPKQEPKKTPDTAPTKGQTGCCCGGHKKVHHDEDGLTVTIPYISAVDFYENIVPTDDGETTVTTTKVTFKDGTHTVVKRYKDDQESKETAIAYALLKRIFGEEPKDPAKKEVKCSGLHSMLHGYAVVGNRHYACADGLQTPKADKNNKTPVGTSDTTKPTNKPFRDAHGRFAKRPTKGN